MQTFRNVEDGEADLPVDTWNPTDLDIDQWLDAAVSAGAQYVGLTAKAGGGFALWPTAYHVDGYDPYSIAQTTWYANNGNPDIVSLFCTKARTRGLGIVLYYAMVDNTYESRSGTTKLTDPTSYMNMCLAQITELLSNYGNITAIWTDGWGYAAGNYMYMPYAPMANLIRSLQPNCLLIENNHMHPPNYGDIEVYETPVAADGSIPTGNTRLCEEINTIRTNGHWYYSALDGQTAAAFKTSATILAAIAQANNNSATYFLDCTPGTDGHLPAAQVTILGEVGA